MAKQSRASNHNDLPGWAAAWSTWVGLQVAGQAAVAPRRPLAPVATARVKQPTVDPRSLLRRCTGWLRAEHRDRAAGR